MEIGHIEFTEVMELIVKVFEGLGVAIITIGCLHTIFRGLSGVFDREDIYQQAKRSFGRPLVLGLEVLVAADIIDTITVSLTLENVLSLGILVLIRVVLSFSLEIEMDGALPWRPRPSEA